MNTIRIISPNYLSIHSAPYADFLIVYFFLELLAFNYSKHI